MIEEQLKFFLDNNFNDEDKFSLIRENDLSAIMANYYNDYPLSEIAKNMKSNNHVIHIVKQGQMVKLIKDFNRNDISVSLPLEHDDHRISAQLHEARAQKGLLGDSGQSEYRGFFDSVYPGVYQAAVFHSYASVN